MLIQIVSQRDKSRIILLLAKEVLDVHAVALHCLKVLNDTKATCEAKDNNGYRDRRQELCWMNPMMDQLCLSSPPTVPYLPESAIHASHLGLHHVGSEILGHVHPFPLLLCSAGGSHGRCSSANTNTSSSRKLISSPVYPSLRIQTQQNQVTTSTYVTDGR